MAHEIEVQLGQLYQLRLREILGYKPCEAQGKVIWALGAG
jgi:hypothetical protein